jgi:hypothetical protein
MFSVITDEVLYQNKFNVSRAQNICLKISKTYMECIYNIEIIF